MQDALKLQQGIWASYEVRALRDSAFLLSSIERHSRVHLCLVVTHGFVVPWGVVLGAQVPLIRG